MTAAEAAGFAYLHWQRQTDPPYYVNSVAISADGERVVAGTFFHVYAPQMTALPAPPALADQFGTYCFNRDGDQLWADKFEGYEGVYSVAISGQGNIAASGGWYSSSPFQGFVRAYEVDNGPANILDFRPRERVNALALSSDGSTLVAAADKVYLFQMANGVFPSEPAELTLVSSPAGTTTPNSAQSVAITSDGTWILVGDYYGNVYLVENNAGSFGTPYVWSDSTLLSTIHSVAMTPDGGWFVVAGGGSSSTVYLFSAASMKAKPPTYSGAYTLDTGGRVGWVAITDDGSFITAIGNTGKTGSVVGIYSDGLGTLSKQWETATEHNPNSTSMDSAGKFVTVADGYPDGQPGTFTLLDGTNGDVLWSYSTSNMNWPMFISSDGSGIAAGTDSGNVYYFTPTATETFEREDA